MIYVLVNILHLNVEIRFLGAKAKNQHPREEHLPYFYSMQVQTYILSCSCELQPHWYDALGLRVFLLS